MNASTNKRVGTYLKTLRQEQRLTQDELALKCNETQSFVSKIECGQRNLCLYEVFVYANALNMDPGALYKGIVSHIAGQTDLAELAE